MDVELQEAIVNIVVAIFGLAGVIITYVVVPFVRANTTERQRGMAWRLAQTAYAYAVDHYDVETAKSEAVTRLRNRLKEYGLNFSESDITDLIESAEDEFTK